MSIVPKKKLETEEIDDNNDMYKEFEETKVEPPKEEVKEESPKEEKIDNSKLMPHTMNVEEKKETVEDNPHVFKEKEYKHDSLAKNTKVTKHTAASRAILIGFYLIIIVLAVIAVLMIRSNKYEFYLKNNEVFINTGSSYQVELTPKDIRYFDYMKYNYSIADTNIATVDEFGTVTAKAQGTTTLKIGLDFGLTSKTMKIVSEYMDISEVDIRIVNDDKLESKDTINLDVNESVTIKAIINNRTDLNASAKYVSSDTDIVSVDEFGNVTGKKEGTATITATVNDIEDTLTIIVKDTGEVTPVTPPVTPKPGETNKPVVTPKPGETNKPVVTNKPTASTKPSTTKASKVSLGVANQITKYVGSAIQLSAKIEPSNASKNKVTWSSSNTKVATVDTKGLVVCLTTGTVTITAEVDGVKASTTILVKNKGGASNPTPVVTSSERAPSGTQFSASAIKLDKTSLDVSVGKQATFTVTVTKATGLIKISSSNASIAKVDFPEDDPESPVCYKETSSCFLDGFTKSDSLTFTVTGVKKGTAYINISVDDMQTSKDEEVTGSAKVGILVK